jgi:glycosyltransferase involved in cell wall biosynthesis
MAEEDRLVSVVIAFLNEERFLNEAVASVYGQTYPHWELLLVDDGSSDGSSEIAKDYARRDPERVRYLEHAGHRNRGASATRNLGVRAAHGAWVGFLDGDDVWFPERLNRCVAFARKYPEAEMVYGKAEYWHSWQGDGSRDRVQPHHFVADRLVRPPELLQRYLSLRAALPGMSSLFISRHAYLSVGGFEEQFRGLVDDAVFLGKFCLRYAVYVSNECLDRYRQHPESDTAVAEKEGRMRREHRYHLVWLQAYIERQGIQYQHVHSAVRRAIRRLDRDPGDWRGRFERMLRHGRQWCLQRFT